MPKFTYKAEPNKSFELLPDGDYLVEILEADPCISQANKYRGAEQFEIKFRDSKSGAEFLDWLTFHAELEWKVDNFISCFNFPVVKGEEIDITPDDLIGRKGWVRVGHYTKNDKKYNQVAIYYTNKEKFARTKLEVPAEAEEAAPW
jgi:hypothetical protein